MFIFVISIIFIELIGKSHNKSVGSIVYIDQIPNTFISFKN